MEWYLTTADLIYGGICWTFITSCVLCAVFRWFHLCRPYDQDPDYYYPARRFVCAFYLCQLLYLPFVVRPSEPHTLVYTRSVGLLLTTTFLPLILNRYFKSHIKPRCRYGNVCYVCPLVAMWVVGLITLFRPDNVFLCSPTLFLTAVGAVSVVMCVLFLRVIVWLWRKIDRYQKAEYSNEADFPYRFAQKVIFLPWAVIAFGWLIFFTGNRLLMAVMWGSLSVFAVYFAVMILHPQWEKVTDGAEESDNLDTVIEVADEEEALAMADGQEQDDSLSRAVRARVIAIARRRYLEPHLTRRDIIAEFDYGERTAAGAAISAFGFYDMINTLRLEHARRYAEAHPNETKESIAISSGFKDRFALRHAARRIGEWNPEILDGFTPKV